MSAQITPLHRTRYTPYTPRPCLAANHGTKPEAVPEAPMAVDVPCIDLSPPPFWAARRRQMRRDGLMALVCVFGLVALIGFTLTAETTAMTQEIAQ